MHNLDRIMAEQEAIHSQGETYGEAPYGETAYNESNFGELGNQGESPFANEMMEFELASEFMEIAGEQELEGWFKKVFQKLKNRPMVKNFLDSSEGKQITDQLKSSAKDVIETTGPQLGQYVGRKLGKKWGGERGEKFGNKLGKKAGDKFSDWAIEKANLDDEMNQEVLQPARAYTRFVGDTFRRYLTSPHRRLYPNRAVSLAVTQAARNYYPTLLSGGISTIAIGDLPAEGTWRLMGRSIVLDF